MWKIWIDTGGTFTDCIAIDPQLNKHRLKLLSTGVIKCKVLEKLDHHSYKVTLNPSINESILKGYSLINIANNERFKIENYDAKTQIITVNKALNENVFFEITAFEPVPILATRILTSSKLNDPIPKLELRLGTTKGTNALLEKKGSDVTLLITKGFKDLLKIGTQQRPNLFELNISTPPPLYSRVIEIDERIAFDGDILKSVELDNNLIDLIPSKSSIAIAFLNSYANGTNEAELDKYLKKNNLQYTSTSHKISSSLRILPRAETTVVNAYLDPVLSEYFHSIQDKIGEGNFKIISSAGAIVDSTNYLPKDGLLSGPAGGILGAFEVSKQSGFSKIITFDMGGTSTDVAIINESISYAYQTIVGDATIQSPCVDIDTIAAGGGSICKIRNDLFEVGPESAGADPGPACYGKNGPLTITDLNLLAGRIVKDEFAFELNEKRAEDLLIECLNELDEKLSKEELIESFLQVANENMAAAIKKISTKKGIELKELALTTFGGAGGQHACDIAELLGVTQILIPYDAGILSAFGIGLADVDKIKEQLILDYLNLFEQNKTEIIDSLKAELIDSFIKSGYSQSEIITKHIYCYLRFKGQESTIELDLVDNENIEDCFKEQYMKIYGHWIDNREIEVESLKVIMSVKSSNISVTNKEQRTGNQANPHSYQKSLDNGVYNNTPIYKWDELQLDHTMQGPAIITSEATTVYVKKNWIVQLDHFNSLTLKKENENVIERTLSEKASRTLFQNRFLNIATEMGTMLERTSFSVNIKERLDFSCAILDIEGDLIINAPHIPVHLGSLGVCTKKVLQEIKIEEGDIIITNHPKFGGSHLPDVTLISGVFYEKELVGYIANRAHHAEIGGLTPGSMPVNAKYLDEEGVVIPPMYLIKSGDFNSNEIRKILSNARYPTRSIEENFADINGAIASIQLGIKQINSLCKQYGTSEVLNNLLAIKSFSSSLLSNKLKGLKKGIYHATELLDDGAELEVRIEIIDNNIIFDFTGTSGVHSGNLNANPAIVQSVILYILRIIVNENIPLNEGLMEHVKVLLPECLLNPSFSGDTCPAVVGGNTEVSQRLTDTIIKALGLTACSQGTMNNLLFGNERFGYYETICGGTGAGDGFDGHDAIHQHMTNTKITDPEIIELKYPVRIDSFEIRKESGGKGKYHGGNGVTRKFTFLDKLVVTLLTQHREIAPYGLNGGEHGKTGEQFLIRNGEKYKLNSQDKVNVANGDQLIIKTPGGGGYGLIS